MINNPVKHWRDTKKFAQLLGKQGKLLVWTKVFSAPAGFDHQSPYLAGIVKLDDGQKITVQIVDCQEEDLKVNQKVKLVIRRGKKPVSDEIVEYILKAQPL